VQLDLICALEDAVAFMISVRKILNYSKQYRDITVPCTSGLCGSKLKGNSEKFSSGGLLLVVILTLLLEVFMVCG